jgi:hypothetical protein
MLIAIFNDVYSDYKSRKTQIWRLGFYTLIEEYKRPPYMPAPLSVFEMLYFFQSFFYKEFYKCLNKRTSKVGSDEFKNNETLPDNKKTDTDFNYLLSNLPEWMYGEEEKDLHKFQKLCYVRYVQSLNKFGEDNDKMKALLSKLRESLN